MDKPTTKPTVTFGKVGVSRDTKQFLVIVDVDGVEYDGDEATMIRSTPDDPIPCPIYQWYAPSELQAVLGSDLPIEADGWTAKECRAAIVEAVLSAWAERQAKTEADDPDPGDGPPSGGSSVQVLEDVADVAQASPEAARRAEDAGTLFRALAPSTRAAYMASWRAFQASGQPLTDRGLRSFVLALHEQGAAPGTIRLRAAGVRWVAKTLGRPLPGADQGSVATAALRTTAREGAGRGRGQVVGAGWALADTAARLAEQGKTTKGLRDAAMVALASDALLRVSEVAALDVGDVERRSDGSGRLTVRRSKTDQAGEGKVLYVGAPTMRRLRNWTRQADLEDGPMFRPVTRGGNPKPRRMDARSVRAVFAARLRDAGAEGHVSGHSLRVGSACSLVRRGADLPALMQAGRWKRAETPARYVEGEAAGRGAVARLRYGR